MKTKNLLMMAASLAVVFSSCSKEQEPGADAVSAAGEKTYARFSISFPSMGMTRAMPDDPNATDAEKQITGGTIYIIDGTGVSATPFTDAELEEPKSHQAAGFRYLNKAIATTTGEKRVYVVLNHANTALNLTSNATLFGGGNPLKHAETAFVNGTTDMVMSSVAEVKKDIKVKYATAQEALNETETDDAKNNTFAITVQRNTAKVAVVRPAQPISLTGAANGDAQIHAYAMAAKAKESYLIQQGGNTLLTVTTPATEFVKKAEVNGPAIAGLGNYWTGVPAQSEYKLISTESSDIKDYAAFYLLENKNAEKVEGNTTFACISAQLAPKNAIQNYTNGVPIGSVNITMGQDFAVRTSNNTVYTKTAYEEALNSSTNKLAATDFRYYINGGAYYKNVYVQDAAKNQGVLRNNYYVMTVTGVTGFGSPVFPGNETSGGLVPGGKVPDPENPAGNPDIDVPAVAEGGKGDDKDKPTTTEAVGDNSFITVSVSVVPWNLEQSTVTLN